MKQSLDSVLSRSHVSDVTDLVVYHSDINVSTSFCFKENLIHPVLFSNLVETTNTEFLHQGCLKGSCESARLSGAAGRERDFTCSVLLVCVCRHSLAAWCISMRVRDEEWTCAFAVL